MVLSFLRRLPCAVCVNTWPCAFLSQLHLFRSSDLPWTVQRRTSAHFVIVSRSKPYPTNKVAEVFAHAPKSSKSTFNAAKMLVRHRFQCDHRVLSQSSMSSVSFSVTSFFFGIVVVARVRNTAVVMHSFRCAKPFFVMFQLLRLFFFYLCSPFAVLFPHKMDFFCSFCSFFIS